MTFRNFCRFVVAAALSCAPTLSPAQQPWQLTRVTSTTVGVDSSLITVCDSTKASGCVHALSFGQLRKTLSVKAFDSLLTTKLNLTGATITGSPTWSSTFSAAAGQRVDSATGAARSQTLTTARALWGQNFDGSAAITGSLTSVGNLTASGSSTIAMGGASGRLVLQTTTSGSTATTALRFNEQQQSLGITGSVTIPSFTFAADSILGFYRHGTAGANDTLALATNGINSLNFTGGATAKITGGAGNMTITAGTGNFRSLSFQATGQVAQENENFRVTYQAARFSDGSTGVPALAFITDTTKGFARPGSGNFIDVIDSGSVIAAFGINSDTLSSGRFSFDSSGLIKGSARSMTIQSGTGASRRLTMQTTTSGSTATTFLRANELQQSLFADGAVGTPGVSFAADSLLGLYRVGTAGASDTVMIAANGVNQVKIAPAGILRLPLLPAEGSTKNAMCWDGTTFNVTQNAAATCTVSSARFKKNIVPIGVAAAWLIVGRPQLHSSTYEEREGGRKAIGIIAEQADSADTRLASRDASGKITSTNYEEVTSLLLTIVKDQERRLVDQQRRLDSLIKVLIPKKGAGQLYVPAITDTVAKTVFTITPDGRFVLGPGATPDDAARVIADLAMKMFAGQTIQPRKPQ